MIHIINKIKSSKTSYLFILFIVVLISCNAPENMIDEANYKSNIKIDNVEVSELFKRKEFNDIVIKLYKQKNGNELSRTVMENQYGFTILDQPAKVIEQNNKITYTLAISRDNQAGSSMGFENLIISSDSLNQPQAVIVKYRPFVPMNQLLTNNGGFEGEVNVTPITYNNTQVTGKIASDCFEVILSKCTGIPYDCGGEVCGFKRYIICPSAGGDSGETAGTTIGGGSTSGSSTPAGGGSNPITTPNGGGGNSNQQFPDTPCSRLQKGTSSNAYKQKFKALNKLSNFTLPYETGFAQKMVNGALSYINLQAPNGSSLNFPSGSLNFTHVHNNHMVVDENGNDEYDGGVKILSPADVGALITTCQTAAENAAINPTEAFGVMISNEGIFAITLLEPLSINEIGQFNSNLAVFKKEYELKAGNIVKNPNLDATGRKNALQKMLLSLLKKYGLENKVGLFEGEAQDNFDSYDINWTKKALNPTNPDAAPVETPC
nr:hypothetical protein [uncultured Flavobacterium sp.]